jgi:excisionase family DNA binding protein
VKLAHARPIEPEPEPTTASPISRTTPIANLPELLRVPEVAAYADVSPGVIYEAIRCGQIPHVRLGRLVRVPRSALQALMGGRSAE